MIDEGKKNSQVNEEKTLTPSCLFRFVEQNSFSGGGEICGGRNGRSVQTDFSLSVVGAGEQGPPVNSHDWESAKEGGEICGRKKRAEGGKGGIIPGSRTFIVAEPSDRNERQLLCRKRAEGKGTAANSKPQLVGATITMGKTDN